MNKRLRSITRGKRQGFTLVELIAAILILVVGVLGLASTAAVVMRQITGSQMQTRAAVVAQSRFERLRSVNCALATGGTNTANGITETWRTTMQTRSMNMVVVVTWVERGITRTVTFTSQRPCI